MDSFTALPKTLVSNLCQICIYLPMIVFTYIAIKNRSCQPAGRARCLQGPAGGSLAERGRGLRRLSYHSPQPPRGWVQAAEKLVLVWSVWSWLGLERKTRRGDSEPNRPPRWHSRPPRLDALVAVATTEQIRDRSPRTHARTHAHARKHALTHARTHARARTRAHTRKHTCIVEYSTM